MRKRTLLAAALAVAAAFAIPAFGDEPPNVTYAPPAPGKVDQNKVVYLAGQAMHSQWRAVTSRKAVGKNSGGNTVYQWFLSIYAINDTTYKLQYQSPANGGPLDKVTKPEGSTMWFPYQSISIVGAARLIDPTVEQLVVQSHETGADCGSATVTIFAYKNGKVVPAVSLQNGCELTATVVPGGDNTDTLKLSGPYYNSTAPMCCPTKTNASATLRYTNGKWVETPNYYQLYVGKLPPS